VNEIAVRPSKAFVKLCSGAQFRAVYSQGQRFYSPYFSVFILPTSTGEVRLGITVTRKVGKAVIRNRCKRRLREIFRKQQPGLIWGVGYDLVINAKSELANAPFAQVEEAFEQALRHFQAFLQKRARAVSAAVNTGETETP
jgi:ribonuclease P protein component